MSLPPAAERSRCDCRQGASDCTAGGDDQYICHGLPAFSFSMYRSFCFDYTALIPNNQSLDCRCLPVSPPHQALRMAQKGRQTEHRAKPSFIVQASVGPCMCSGKEGRRACLILLRQMFGCSIAVKIDIWCTEEDDGEAVSLSKTLRL